MDINKTIEQRVEKLERQVAALMAMFSSQPAPLVSREKKMSPKEFLMTKILKTEMQKTLALAYYIEYLGGMECFNVTDLEAVFRSAKERLPKNMNDAVNKNIARGFLMEAVEKKDNKKTWVLTSTGEKCVEEDLKKSN
jgi:hypothetical protein